MGDGRMIHDEVLALAGLLGKSTATPESCFFCVWEGWGGLEDLVPKLARENRVLIPGRHCSLGIGPIEGVVAAPESPMLWWPADRAWCVASEIDFAWTYVGGSHSLIDAVLADDRLEALPPKITDKFSFDSDTINR